MQGLIEMVIFELSFKEERSLWKKKNKQKNFSESRMIESVSYKNDLFSDGERFSN